MAATVGSLVGASMFCGVSITGRSSHWGIRWSVCVAQSSDSSSCTLVSVVVSGWSQSSLVSVLAVLAVAAGESEGGHGGGGDSVAGLHGVARFDG